jgi:hypothetical protein
MTASIARNGPGRLQSGLGCRDCAWAFYDVHADHIVVLDAGVIVEQGTHEALLGQNGRYAALWHTQQQGKSVVELEEAARVGPGTTRR